MKIKTLLKVVILLVVTFVITFRICSLYHENIKNKPSPKGADIENKVGSMSRLERKMISDLIVQTIQDGLDGKDIKYPDLKDFPAKWSEKKVVYTTLNIGDKLRGCRGNLNNKKPLLYAIIDSAYDAAFNNQRFLKLTQEEFDNPDFNFYITVMGEKKKMLFKNENDIIRKLKPLQYGLILTYETEKGLKKRGLFLPSVWKKYPDPERFWKKLKNKAKLKENFFSEKFEVDYFSAETIKDFDFIARQDALRIEKALTAYKKLFKQDGRITYQIDFENRKIDDKNNLVREMGAGYGLAYAYYITHDETLKPLLKRFLTYAETVALPDADSEVVLKDAYDIPAGASALALLAVLYYEQEAKDTSFEQFRIALKNRLLSLFEVGVGVYSNELSFKTSPYYDGETWLAFSVYNIFYPEDAEVSSLMPILNKTMYHKYSNEYLYNFFHWGSQAAAHQFAENQDELMYDYLKKQMNIYVDNIGFGVGSGSCAYAEGLG